MATLRLARNVLCSFWAFRRFDMERLAPLAIIGDSGAFTAATQGAEINVGELAQWAKRWQHRLKWVAALDVIGDPKESRYNWDVMRGDYDVEAIPTIHYGDPPTMMDYYVDRGVDLIGLGGLVGVGTPAQMRWLITVFRYAQAQHPHVQFHGWGLTAQEHLDLPFYSVDSSSWAAPMRFGRAILYDPITNKQYTVPLNGRAVYQPRIAKLLREHYGTTPDAVAVSTTTTEDDIIRMSARSFGVLEDRFRRRHGMTNTPRYGVRSSDRQRAHHLVLSTCARDTRLADHVKNDKRSCHLATTSTTTLRKLARDNRHNGTNEDGLL